MDRPETSIRSKPTEARARSSRAVASRGSAGGLSVRGSVVDIADVPLLLRGTDLARAGGLDRIFGTLPRSEREPDAEVVYQRRGVAVPKRGPDEAYSDLETWHEGEELYLWSAPHRLAVRVDRSRAVIGGPGPVSEHALRRLLHPVFTHLLAWRGVYVLHGAALRRGDGGILAVGQTGQGKSTLALAAMEHGWQVLADDLVAVRVAESGVVIQGVPKPLTLPNDVDARSLDAAETLTWDKRARRRLDPDHLDLRPVPLRSLVVVSHGQVDRATIDPVPANDVTGLLFASFMSTPDAPLLRRFFPVGAAVARVPAWRLGHSTDPGNRLSEAAAALDRLEATW